MGIEPTTRSLKGSCSTTELLAHVIVQREQYTEIFRLIQEDSFSVIIALSSSVATLVLREGR